MADYSDLFNLRNKSLVSINDIADAIAGVRTEHNGGVSSGSSNTYSVTVTPAITTDTLVAGVLFSFVPNFTNTGASTLTVNGVGPKSIVILGQALVGGEIFLNRRALVQYDGTQFVLLNHGGGWATWTPSISSSMTLSSPDVSHARYRRFGSTIQYWVGMSAVTSGSASNEVAISLPVAASGPDTLYHPGHFIQNSAGEGCAFGYIHASASTVNIRRYDNGVYAVSSNTSFFRVSGSYFV